MTECNLPRAKLSVYWSTTMACFSTLRGYRLLNATTDNGKSVVIFNEGKIGGRPYEIVKIPCGQCLGCRLARARDWAVRCVHEASCHDESCFITLTHNPEDLQERKSLEKEQFVLFMKRLRKRYSKRTIKFFHCGEYGESCRVCGKSRQECRRARQHPFRSWTW